MCTDPPPRNPPACHLRRCPILQSHLSKPVMGVSVEYLMTKYGWSDSVDFIKMVRGVAQMQARHTAVRVCAGDARMIVRR